MDPAQKMPQPNAPPMPGQQPYGNYMTPGQYPPQPGYVPYDPNHPQPGQMPPQVPVGQPVVGQPYYPPPGQQPPYPPPPNYAPVPPIPNPADDQPPQRFDQPVIPEEQEEVPEQAMLKKCLCFQIRVFFITIMVLGVLSFVLMITTLSMRNFLIQGEDDVPGNYKWTGSLLKVEKVDSDYPLPEFNRDWEGDQYQVIGNEDECDQAWLGAGSITFTDSETGQSKTVLAEDNKLCDMFKELHDAGAVYIAFNVLSMICLIGFLILTGAKIWGADRNISQIFIMTIVLVCVSLLLHLIGFASYHGVSRVQLSGTCDDLTTPDSREDICGGSGAKMTVVSFVMHAFLTAFEVITSSVGHKLSN